MGGRLDHDPLFLVATAGLALTGVLFIASATGGEGAHLFLKQLLWVCLGAAVFWVVLRVDYGTWAEFSNLLYVCLAVVLLWLLFFGSVTAGHRSWISLGPLSLQPSEFAKPVIALMVARYCADAESQHFSLRDFIVPLLYVAIPVGLIAAQGDMGTAVTFAPILGTAWFLSGIRFRTLAAVALAASLFLPVMWFTMLKPYQKERVLTVVNPTRDPQGSGYQVIQSRIAVGSGGLAGKGVFSGTQSRLDFLPAHHTDFIYSVIAEETGFLGSVVVMGLYLLLFHRILTAAMLSRDRQGAFLAMCVMTVLGLHFVLNLGMVLGLLPTIGIPLPLLSYGGSSMLATCFLLGLAYNVRMRRFREPV